jgi:hypothetical protein
MISLEEKRGERDVSEVCPLDHYDAVLTSRCP